MSRLLVLTTRELAAGYRLAGVAVLDIASPEETQLLVQRLLHTEDGVIAVHAPFFDALAPSFRRRLEALQAPLVVPLPTGTLAEQGDGRRARLLQMLRQAVGYEITFGAEGTKQ